VGSHNVMNAIRSRIQSFPADLRPEWVTQLLRQGDSQVFKRYSQMK
jgi:hypothetical protein